MHRVYLSIGSNIEPEINLLKAVDLLSSFGTIQEISSVWESQAVGAPGQPNFLNACILLETLLHRDELKEKLVRPIEAALGRKRTSDKNAPRTIDIDVILVDDEPVNFEKWDYPFVVVPLAELVPQAIHPVTNKKIIRVAEQTRSEIWIEKRSEIMKSTKQGFKHSIERTQYLGHKVHRGK